MKVTIIHPVRHNGKRYAAGDNVDLSKEAAQALVDCGSAESAAADSEAKSKADADAKAKADAEAKAKADADAKA